MRWTSPTLAGGDYPAVDHDDTHTVPTVRSMEHMLQLLRGAEADGASGLRTADGYCRPLLAGNGFHYVYDGSVARGGWRFYRLADGLSVAVVDVVAEIAIPRQHRLTDHVVLSAVLDGDLNIADQDGAEGGLAKGFATVYGLLAGQGFETLYEPGQALRWISVFIERRHFAALTGLGPDDLPEDVLAFLDGAGRLPYHNVPLTHAAALVIHQIIEPAYNDAFQRYLLTLKALELACHILHSLERAAPPARRITKEELGRVERALTIMRATLDEPRTIGELARAVGMAPKRLQLGFRARYGATVGQVQEGLRMELALDLVRSSPMSITAIAFETGYEHPASFTRAFKAAFGLSPLAFRNADHNSAYPARLPQ